MKKNNANISNNDDELTYFSISDRGMLFHSLRSHLRNQIKGSLKKIALCVVETIQCGGFVINETRKYVKVNEGNNYL